MRTSSPRPSALPLSTFVVAVVLGLAEVLAGATPAGAATPTLTVRRVIGGLTVPWDVTWVGPVMLVDERPGRLWSLRSGGSPQRVQLDLPPVYAHGESGLLGMVADPKAADNGYFYTCLAVARDNGDPKAVEVWKWQLTSDTTAERVRRLIGGIPLTTGRHSGCRLRFRSERMLYVGTGDAATGTNPQRLSSLGGKVLRVRSDGVIPRTNPFYATGGNARYVWSYGHRNVQGLAKRPGRDELWSAEHGTSRDDEVNRVLKGRNYGWSPTPGYDESRPMTDLTRFPDAVRARWRSGYPTVATSGASFLSGAQWKSWNGRLAVAMLKGEGVRVFTVSSEGKITGQLTRLTSYGRIRTVQQGPDGALYLTTSNGDAADGVYRVTPG